MKRHIQRRKKGSVLPLVVSLTLILALLGAGLCHLLLAMGAGNEIQNAVNAGALRVGQHVLMVEDHAKPEDKDQFQDIAWTKDGQPHFSVGNINRAMAKAMLVAANNADMWKTGYGNEIANGHARQIEQSAQKIANSIKKELCRKNVENEFGAFANSNTLRMGAFKTTVKAHKEQWETAYLDAGKESNVWLNTNALPPSQRKAFATVQKSGKTYIKGYENSNLTNLRMVPFRHGERPALVSASEFTPKQKPAVDTDLPNAFACHGTATTRNGHDAIATAMVQTNPQQEFEMRAKDGWIRIVLHANDVDFFLEGIKADSDKYGHRPGMSSAFWFPIPIGACKVSATCGNEFTPPSVWACMFPPLCWGDSDVQSNLVQRLRALRPDLSDDDLKAPLKKTWVDLSSRSDQVFYVFLDRNDNITVRPAGSADIPPTVRQYAQPDGTGRGADQHYLPLPNIPNFSTASIYGLPLVTVTTFCTLEGGVNWIPSTGFNGCLGQVEHKDTTKCWIIVLPDP